MSIQAIQESDDERDKETVASVMVRAQRVIRLTATERLEEERIDLG